MKDILNNEYILYMLRKLKDILYYILFGGLL